MRKLSQTWSFILTYSLIPLLANFSALLFSRFLLAPLLGIHMILPSETPFRVHLLHFIFADLMAFIAPLLLVWIYLYPALRYLKKKDCCPDLSLRRALNAPFFISLISTTGWFIGVSGIVLELLMPHNFILLESSGKIIVKIVSGGFFTAFTAFVVSFYILEWINRKQFILHFFPQGTLSHIQKVFKISTQTRFIIFFIVVSFYPILLLRAGAAQLKNLLPDNFLSSSELLSVFRAEMTISAGFVILGIFLTRIFSKYYEKPLEILKKASEQIRNGNYQVKVPVLSSDELGYLSESFNLMATQMNCYVSKLTESNQTLENKVEERTRELEQERNQLRLRNLQIENEIRLARQIQKNLIPAKPPLENIASLYEPMDVVGGDFYDFVIFKEDDGIGLFLSDVSGHGIPAAFITSMLKSFILQAGPLRRNPQELLRYVNQGLYGQTAGNFVTAFYGIYYPSTQKLIYANAAHNSPYLISPSGEISLLPSEGRGLPLAAFDNEFLAGLKNYYSNQEILLAPQTKLLLYTDGLVEAAHFEDPAQDKTFEEVIPEILPAFGHLHPKEIVSKLFESLIQFRGNSQFEDDVCLICMEV